MSISHHILLVDDEPQIGKSMGRLLAMEGILFTYAESTAEALTLVQSADPPFSLVISDQRMPDMPGTEFLKQVKDSAPDSIRFLLTAYSDMDTVTDAINQGAVHRFINKPWDNDALMEEIHAALDRFAHQYENKRLFNTAVQQNKKLFLLDRKLMESQRNHTTILDELDMKISATERRIQELNQQAELFGVEPEPGPEIQEPPSTETAEATTEEAPAEAEAETDAAAPPAEAGDAAQAPEPPPEDAAPLTPEQELQAALKAHLEEGLEHGEEGTTPAHLLDELHTRCLGDLFHQFTLLANRNGFDMPLPEMDI